jgi:hypothetical protein
MSHTTHSLHVGTLVDTADQFRVIAREEVKSSRKVYDTPSLVHWRRLVSMPDISRQISDSLVVLTTSVDQIMVELLYISGGLVPPLQSQYGYVYHEIIHTHDQHSFSFVRDKGIGDQHLDLHPVEMGQLNSSEGLPRGRSDTADFLANAQARG